MDARRRHRMNARAVSPAVRAEQRARQTAEATAARNARKAERELDAIAEALNAGRKIDMREIRNGMKRKRLEAADGDTEERQA